MTWSPGSSPFFPYNLGMSEGSLIGTDDEVVSWHTRSFISHIKAPEIDIKEFGVRNFSHQCSQKVGWGFPKTPAMKR